MTIALNDAPLSLSDHAPADEARGSFRGVRLAFETSIRGGSLAIGTESGILIADRLPADQRSAASLIPAIARHLAAPPIIEAMENTPQDPHQPGHPPHPSVIAIADGPGSFTGLRIAVTAAKSLTYAWDAKLIVVDTLAAVAAAAMLADETIERVQVVANAYRNQVFIGDFDRRSLFDAEDGSAARGKGVSVQLAAEVDDQPLETGQQAENQKTPNIRISDIPSRNPDFPIDHFNIATGVAALAQPFERRGEWFDPSVLVPRYLKRSAAEESLSDQK